MIHPFLKYNIETDQDFIRKTVSMSKGAYLIIEHEALHVIGGNRSNKATNQKTAMEVNMIAAAEIARQLRLRDMGGIIVIISTCLILKIVKFCSFLRGK
jgi:ribonuclease G